MILETGGQPLVSLTEAFGDRKSNCKGEISVNEPKLSEIVL